MKSNRENVLVKTIYTNTCCICMHLTTVNFFLKIPNEPRQQGYANSV